MPRVRRPRRSGQTGTGPNCLSMTLQPLTQPVPVSASKLVCTSPRLHTCAFSSLCLFHVLSIKLVLLLPLLVNEPLSSSPLKLPGSSSATKHIAHTHTHTHRRTHRHHRSFFRKRLLEFVCCGQKITRGYSGISPLIMVEDTEEQRSRPLVHWSEGASDEGSPL